MNEHYLDLDVCIHAFRWDPERMPSDIFKINSFISIFRFNFHYVII